MDGIKGLAGGIAKEIHRLLPNQRKTQRNNLSLLVATMLDVRSANLMDLAAGLPRDAERIDMRYQWISRVLMNPLIDPDAVMAPFAREVVSRLAAEGQPQGQRMIGPRSSDAKPLHAHSKLTTAAGRRFRVIRQPMQGSQHGKPSLT